jgi:metallo-beta-lactamase family protein
LIESTYGDRLHKTAKTPSARFKQVILDSFNRRGNIIIPSFAIERTQEIIYVLGRLIKKGEIPPIPVYIDSPLAIAATEVFKKNAHLLDDEMRALLSARDNPLDLHRLHYTRSPEESKGWTNRGDRLS